MCTAPSAEDKSLCIAKAVDLKNGYPILSWLLDSFSRDRVNGHRKLFLKANVDSAEYPFDSDKYCSCYNATRWWLDNNAFCKFIQYRNPKMALPIMTALHSLSKRILPPIEFNPALLPLINDDLNEFVKYTLSYWQFVHTLNNANESVNDYIPIQSYVL